MVSAFYGRTHPSLPEVIFGDLVKKTLTEDLGSGGDITSERLIDKELEISAEIVAREPGMLAGDSVAALTFKTVDPILSPDCSVAITSICFNFLINLLKIFYYHCNN